MMKNLDKERVHDLIILNQGIRPEYYEVSSKLFKSLQEVSEAPRYSDGFLHRVAGFFGFVPKEHNFSPYLIVLGFNPENGEHQRYFSPNGSDSMVGRKFSELKLKHRVNLGYESPLVLNRDGVIFYVNPSINIPGINGDGDYNGKEISNHVDGTCVYFMDSMGYINRYDRGKLTFSTEPKELEEIVKRVPPNDVRELRVGFEHPNDLLIGDPLRINPFGNYPSLSAF